MGYENSKVRYLNRAIQPPPSPEILRTFAVSLSSHLTVVEQKAIASTLSQTRLSYIDLYLIHAPYGGAEARRGTWRALVEAQKAGTVRSVGVSNYGLHHLRELENVMAEEGGNVDVGQWELHPWLTRDDIVGWCRDHGTIVQAYCPLVRGKRAGEEALTKIAEKHGKTWAQILMRWSLQKVLYHWAISLDIIPPFFFQLVFYFSVGPY